MANVSSNNLIKGLAAEVLSAELEPLGIFMDRMETRLSKAAPADRAAKFQTVASRARALIERGVGLAGVRRECGKSPALQALLEAVLFDRAAARGRKTTSVDWSRYGR